MATAGSGVEAMREQLLAGKVIPDVVGSMAPGMLDMRVKYKEMEVANGLAVRRAQARMRPHVELHGPSAAPTGSERYALLMVDPDAPSPSSRPSFRGCFLHWLVIDIPGSIPPSQEIWQAGREVVVYMGPSPPEGEHRYVFLLFKHQGSPPFQVHGVSSDNRKNFHVEDFARSNHLGDAVGGCYYTASPHDELQYSGQQV